MRFTDAEISSTGAFLVGELERLDQELYAPLADFTWSRDIDLREDVTIADEVTSFMLANYAGGFGSIGGSGKSWIKGMDHTRPAALRRNVEGHDAAYPVGPWKCPTPSLNFRRPCRSVARSTFRSMTP